MDSEKRHRMLVLALLGTGVGVAFFGYSYVHDPRTSAEKVAQALRDALQGTTVTAQGELTLKPGQEVALADGATVDLERNAKVGLESGATVRLDPSATVDGGLPAPQAIASSLRPTEAQMNMGRRGANIARNSTIFSEVAFGKGKAVTGWNFESNASERPVAEN